jgi:ribosome-binding protein aMBF1 (putative translation factor)
LLPHLGSIRQIHLTIKILRHDVSRWLVRWQAKNPIRLYSIQLSVFGSPTSLHPVKMRRLEMSDAFALVLRRQREARGFSQEVLAEKSDLHPTYIGMLERCLRNPSLNVTKKLAQALGMPLSKLIAEAEAAQQKSNSRK